jgi:hypothetical protein
VLARTGAILGAAMLVVGLAAFYAISTQPPKGRRRVEAIERRPSGPSLRALPRFAGEFVTIGAIAFAGRTILRLRLDDR